MDYPVGESACMVMAAFVFGFFIVVGVAAMTLGFLVWLTFYLSG